MRIFSLIQLLLNLMVFGIYYYVIDPLFTDNILPKLLIFTLIWSSLNYFSKKLEGRFIFLEKRIDKQLSLMIVFGLFFGLLFIIEI